MLSPNKQQSMIHEVCVSVYNELTATMLPDEHREVYLWLLDLRLKKRPYYLARETTAFDLWKEIRTPGNEFLLDFVARGLSLFIMHVGGSSGIGTGRQSLIENLADQIAVSLTAMKIPAVRKPIADEQFTDLIPQEVDLKTLLKNDPWLIFLICLEMSISSLKPPSGHINEVHTEDTAEH